jgi:hypothetical protein
MSASASHAASWGNLVGDRDDSTGDAALAGAGDVGEGHGERRAYGLKWIDRWALYDFCIAVLAVLPSPLIGYLPSIYRLSTGYLEAIDRLSTGYLQAI